LLSGAVSALPASSIPDWLPGKPLEHPERYVVWIILLVWLLVSLSVLAGFVRAYRTIHRIRFTYSLSASAVLPAGASLTFLAIGDVGVASWAFAVFGLASAINWLVLSLLAMLKNTSDYVVAASLWSGLVMLALSIWLTQAMFPFDF